MRCPEVSPGAGTWLTSYSLLKVSTKFHETHSSEKVPTKTKRVSLYQILGHLSAEIFIDFFDNAEPGLTINSLLKMNTFFGKGAY